jgi:hypothetical protein
VYTVRFTASATAVFGRLTPEQRRRILRLIGNVQVDPTPDNDSKFTLYELGSMYTICRDHQGYWVVYHVHAQTISVVGVGVGSPYTSPPPADA